MSLDIFQYPCAPSLKSGHCYQHGLSAPQQHLGLIFLMPISLSNIFISSVQVPKPKMFTGAVILKNIKDTNSSQKHLLCNTKTSKANPLIQWANYLGIMQDQNQCKNSIFLTHTARFRKARELRRFKLAIIYSYASTQHMQV